MRGPLSGAAETYNYVEIGIWCATATVAAVVALRRAGRARRDFAVASIVLFTFGASDYAHDELAIHDPATETEFEVGSRFTNREQEARRQDRHPQPAHVPDASRSSTRRS